MGILASLFSLPYMILFFAVWILALLIRPVLLASVLACLCQPLATLRKLQLFVTTLQYLLFCNDKKFKVPKEDPASFFPDEEQGGNDGNNNKVQSKTIIFVRHGESCWNDTFNKGDRPKIKFLLDFLPNLIHALYMEWYFFVSGRDTESWFYDSPLSEKGLRQARGIQTFLRSSLQYATPREAELIRIMQGVIDSDSSKDNRPSSQLVSSNLRRAISTMAVGFQDRLEQKKQNDAILILPQLQEISFNPDALSITPAKGTVVSSWTDPDYLEDIFANQIDTSLHTGNKPVLSNGGKRLREFCDSVFEDISKDNVIVGGHSLWFRSFFQTFLPRTMEHVSKKKKLINGGCVGFVLKRIKSSEGKYQYLVDPSSITVLHGGF